MLVKAPQTYDRDNHLFHAKIIAQIQLMTNIIAWA